APGPVLVRMHALNPMDDVLGLRPGRAGQTAAAMRLIAAEGRGVIVLLRDTDNIMARPGTASPQRLRQYGLGAQILAALGVHEMILLTNSPSPRPVGIEGYGLAILGTRPIPTEG
ncbi:MAG: 3,4-dihydroxy-2-butanone-4-phosphate synthase, partial [Alphaproteobacteria bacterium HGW-Alphaproteobacteria-2]